MFKSGLGSVAVGGVLHVLFAPSTSPEHPERIIGVAAWFPPGKSYNATPEQLTGWEAFVEAVERKEPKLKAWWLDHVRACHVAFKESRRLKPLSVHSSDGQGLQIPAPT